MSKISIKLQGGLGNLMFQIACAKAYSLRHNKELILSSDNYGFGHNHFSFYNDNIFSNIEIKDVKLNGFTQWIEPGFNYINIPNTSDSLYLNGYYQNEKYFKDFKSEIKELFSYPNGEKERILTPYKETLINNEVCSIHVRRGDYLNLPDHHPVQNMNYYMKAIKMMPRDCKFLIFSDDLEWCKQNFPDISDKFIFVDGNKDYEDLLIMSQCNHNIIANSSFSWWAAWLNCNHDKKVIAPLKWFGPAHSHLDSSDIYAENWITI